jgi:hypothetical protein
MHASRRIALALLTTAVFAGSALASASALAAPVTPVLTTSLAPSVPTDPVLHGVTAGSAPWVLKNSVAVLNNGFLVVNIRGTHHP